MRSERKFQRSIKLKVKGRINCYSANTGCFTHAALVPHARTLRKAREQVKVMVADDVSLPRIKAYLNQWGQRWQKTSSTWNYEELSQAYIKSCWDPHAAKIAAAAFQQNYFTQLGNNKTVALAA